GGGIRPSSAFAEASADRPSLSRPFEAPLRTAPQDEGGEGAGWLANLPSPPASSQLTRTPSERRVPLSRPSAKAEGHPLPQGERAARWIMGRKTMASGLQLSRDELLAAYRRMRLIREFEERVHDEFSAGNIPGFVHLYAGEEASGVGVCMHLDDRDAIASTHRGHGHCIAKGVDPGGMMKEIYG